MTDTSNIDKLLAALDEANEHHKGCGCHVTALVAKEVIEVLVKGLEGFSNPVLAGDGSPVDDATAITVRDLDISLLLEEANAIAAKLEEKRG